MCHNNYDIRGVPVCHMISEHVQSHVHDVVHSHNSHSTHVQSHIYATAPEPRLLLGFARQPTTRRAHGAARHARDQASSCRRATRCADVLLPGDSTGDGRAHLLFVAKITSTIPTIVPTTMIEPSSESDEEEDDPKEGRCTWFGGRLVSLDRWRAQLLSSEPSELCRGPKTLRRPVWVVRRSWRSEPHTVPGVARRSHSCLRSTRAAAAAACAFVPAHQS